MTPASNDALFKAEASVISRGSEEHCSTVSRGRRFAMEDPMPNCIQISSLLWDKPGLGSSINQRPYFLKAGSWFQVLFAQAMQSAWVGETGAVGYKVETSAWQQKPRRRAAPWNQSGKRGYGMGYWLNCGLEALQ